MSISESVIEFLSVQVRALFYLCATGGLCIFVLGRLVFRDLIEYQVRLCQSNENSNVRVRGETYSYLLHPLDLMRSFQDKGDLDLHKVDYHIYASPIDHQVFGLYALRRNICALQCGFLDGSVGERFHNRIRFFLRPIPNILKVLSYISDLLVLKAADTSRVSYDKGGLNNVFYTALLKQQEHRIHGISGVGVLA